jgi:hypothetical protein
MSVSPARNARPTLEGLEGDWSALTPTNGVTSRLYSIDRQFWRDLRLKGISALCVWWCATR